MGQTVADLHNAPAEIRQIATKLFWWKSEPEALEDPIRLAAQVMALGTWREVQAVKSALGEEVFLAVLQDPPAGVFDPASWTYWHRVFKLTPIPDLPKRHLPQMTQDFLAETAAAVTDIPEVARLSDQISPS